MKNYTVLLFLLLANMINAQEQEVSKYLESIRNNEAALTAFFSAMPKGGDLHHHYSGSVYAESYVNYAVNRNYMIDTVKLLVSSSNQTDSNWVYFSKLDSTRTLNNYKELLLEKWSVKDYNGISLPSDQQFFNTFGLFGAVYYSYDSGLLEIKKRALKENVSYIETMFTTIPFKITDPNQKKYEAELRQLQVNRDRKQVMQLLKKLDDTITSKGLRTTVKTFNDSVVNRHKRLRLDDENFTIRYQNYAVRTMQPYDVFKALLASFESANTCDLIVGVNIVAPENNEVSMNDYWLHMMMFRYCHKKYPNVKYAMHAGELVLGMVKPEELTWHINAAVNLAGANRIGHGVDMAYEEDSYALLREMEEKQTAIEINLASNEFILKVKNSAHPISLYKKFNVPICISTDDAGVLRSNLTHQYVLLAKRYRDISYSDIKTYVYNSISYSFIKETDIVYHLRKQLDEAFDKFEQSILRLPH